jgi:hypothetical protein
MTGGRGLGCVVDAGGVFRTTVTEAVPVAVPFGPRARRVYEVLAKGETKIEPDLPTPPTPEMVTLVALEVDQESETDSP